MPKDMPKSSLPFKMSILGSKDSRPPPPAASVGMPLPASTFRSLIRKSTTIQVSTKEVVQVWLAGEWKTVAPMESAAIIKKRNSGVSNFETSSRGDSYRIDLVQMTQTNIKSGRSRSIRIVDLDADAENTTMGFDSFRKAFQERADSSKVGLFLTEEALRSSWPYDGDDEELLKDTVEAAMQSMSLRGRPQVDMTEWIHYWALERDGPSQAAASEVNEQLRAALQKDSQILGRMQMQFESAARLVDGGALGLTSAGLLQVCKRLVASPQTVMEKQWAQEVLQKNASGGEALEEDEELSYHDFLNVMLGRKRFKVYLWMYDITDGAAKRWSWLLLGQEFKGFWHTGLVVEWPGQSSEIWFGGKIFDSAPGATPFGQPTEKRFLGYTYKHKDDALNHISRYLCPEFTKDNYDVLTHNCNHFSDKLAMYLRNEHIPEDVLRQPEAIMNTTAAKALRPWLNRWLGGFDSKDGQASQFGESERLIKERLGPCALVEFAKKEGGRLQIGRVEEVDDDSCVITSLDFWHGCAVERHVPKLHIAEVLQQGLQKSRSIPELDQMLKSSTRFLEQRVNCDWLPSLLTPCCNGVSVHMSGPEKISVSSLNLVGDGKTTTVSI
eukprot:gb/GFBE01061881.1/.p1 GENE.gb/GFBE01061881.1/~~gb/GFBE01061881.1/.p1  ORF type:complete len:611 (+),score=140.28 gb/GFBE01061881.1/:1-1833(+)